MWHGGSNLVQSWQDVVTGVQSAPCHTRINLSRTGPFSCWSQISQYQSSSGWAEPRHFWEVAAWCSWTKCGNEGLENWRDWYGECTGSWQKFHKRAKGFLERRRFRDVSSTEFPVWNVKYWGLWCKVSSMKYCTLSQVGWCQIGWARRRWCAP